MTAKTLTELERLYDGPIPTNLIAEMRSQRATVSSARKPALRAIAVLQRQITTHSHMTLADRQNCLDSIAAWQSWLASKNNIR
jgi:hypothetical protein